MATLHWLSGGGGNWSNAANWSSHPNLPDATSDVVIGALVAGSTISVDGTYAVDSLTLAAGDTVTTTYANSFTISDASGASTNAGTIDIVNYSGLTLGGVFDNSGTIADLAGNNGATITFTGASTTLNGGGHITLDDAGTASVQAAAAGDKLVNVNNTISGGGTLGGGGLVIDNQAAGVIDASSTAAALVIAGAGAISNEGLMDATAAAGLVLRGVAVANSATIEGIGTGTVTLQNASIAGGTLAGAFDTSYADFGNTLDGSAHTITNEGTFTVVNYSAVTVLGTIENIGTISLATGNNSGTLSIGSPVVTLQGGGVVVLADNAGSIITGTTTAELLANVNNTISGSGALGDGQLSVDNRAGGLIEATGGTALVINAGSYTSKGVTIQATFQNEGVLAATNPGKLTTTGGLVINATTIDNTGNGDSGRIEATGTATHVDLLNATIRGGTLIAAAGDVVTTDYAYFGSVLDGTGTAVDLSAGSVLQAVNYSELTFLGTFVNNGTIAALGAANGAYLVAGSATVTLTGGGHVTLDDVAGPTSVIEAASSGDRLVNVNNTILGAGTIGSGGLVVDNQAAGVIDANGVNGTLVLAGSSGFSNEGLIESTSAAGLVLSSIAVTNSSTIQATGSGLVYDENSTISGGRLNGAFTTIYADFGATMDGSNNAITSTGTISLVNYSALNLLGTFVNDGTIAELGGNNGANLVAASATVTLTGGGHVTLNDLAGSTSLIEAAISGDKLVNVNNTISGAGTIGTGGLVFDNQASGVIDANGANGGLVLAGSPGFSNEGLIESTSAAGLVVAGITIANTGTIEATGKGLVYDENSTISGGRLNGAFTTIYADFGATMDGSNNAITSTGTISLVNYSALNLLGTFVNDGTIAELGGNNGANLVAASATVTLTGGGHVTLNDLAGSTSLIEAAISGDKLVNVNNTISGAGTIGTGGLVFDNQASAVIDANGANGGLVLAGSPGFSNEGLIESTSAAGLVVAGITIANTGTIEATGQGLVYDENSTVTGGALAGAFTTVYSQFAAVLNGVSTSGTIAVVNYSAVTLLGDIQNTGLIDDEAAANGGTITIGASATLSGNGQILLADSGTAILAGSATTSVLVNDGNTIAGGGLIGNGSLVLDNAAGLIDATGTTGFVINLSGALTNGGTVEATGTGGVLIENTTLTNNGVIAASGGSVTIAASVKTTNVANGTLTLGGWDATNATLSVAGGPVSVDDGSILLSGKSALVTFGGVAIESSLTTIAGGGHLGVFGGRNFAAKHVLTDNGALALGGGTLSTPGILTITATGRLSGNGTVTSPVNSAGLLDASGGGTLALVGAVTGSSALRADAGSLLRINQAAPTTVTGTITLNGVGSELAFGTAASSKTLETVLTGVGATGTLAVIGTRGYVTTNKLTDSGVLSLGGGVFSFGGLMVGAGAHVVGSGTISNAVASRGTIEANLGLLKLAAGATGSGALLVDAGATLELAATSSAGTLGDAGMLKLDGLTTTATTATIAATGTIQGFGIFLSALANSGTIDASGGLLKLGAVTGGGALRIENAATLELGGASAEAATFAAGAAGALQLDAQASFTGVIDGLALGDRLILHGDLVTSAVVSGSTLTVVGSAGTEKFQVAGALVGNHFAVGSDSHTLTLVVGHG